LKKKAVSVSSLREPQCAWHASLSNM